MLKRVLWSLFIAGLAVDLTGCATLQKYNFAKKRRTEYLRSYEASPLKIPAGLDSQGTGDDYIIPASATPAPATPVGILPPDSLLDKVTRGVVTKAAVKEAARMADAKAVPVRSMPAAQAGVSAVSNNVLPLNQTIAQSWNKVGVALKRNGYKIAVADEKIAAYYILDIQATDELVTKATPIYQVKLQSGADGNAFAYITDESGNAVDAATAQRILTDLSNGLAGKEKSVSFKQMLAPVTRWFKEAF